MPIEYKDTKEFSASQLQRLFLSVNWELGNYPEKLEKAMRNSTHVISAWDQDRLVGLVRALDDGQTVAFLHYLLVDPEYQGMHIADQMMKRILSFFDELLYYFYSQRLDIYTVRNVFIRHDSRRIRV